MRDGDSVWVYADYAHTTLDAVPHNIINPMARSISQTRAICPICKNDNELANKYFLVFDFLDLSGIALTFILVLMVAEFLELNHIVAVSFSMAAILPTILRIKSKKHCCRCEVTLDTER